ncbi:MAG: endonuclease III [Clostridiales bacterium]|jgi:endonuclease-3|nr:endonuclease III [Clostridiales bacterium]
MKTREEIVQLMTRLDEAYPTDEKCYLYYEKPWQLLIATILSAQCTDARVNQVTEGLFRKYLNLEAFAEADAHELEEDVKPTGFYHVKARHIIGTAQKLLSGFAGEELPSDMDSLTSLPGVGRKTANLIRGHVFGFPSVIVDTHVKRISFRLGLTSSLIPEKIETDLRGILPEEHWTRYNMQIIAHGRAVCLARSPRCGRCVLREFCDWPAGETSRV